ncbi:DUF6252 family protein [Flavobacterium sp. '19STA2R22 D10 B1']|uniref:DUF6252 family protein n=1 Tax=Flavobacterium aerium TaxID=3037261 RepID=UPI00278C6F86|nr:DUF6252 family protein [Flavobacterium sp. '19STA2R22 D10 B1']
MKKIKFLSVLFLMIGAISFTACDNEPLDPALGVDNGGNGGLTPNNSSFKVNFNGQTFVSSSTNAVIANNKIRIVATRGTNGEHFGFIIDGTTVGTYVNNALVEYTPSNTTNGYGYSNVYLGNDPSVVPFSEVKITTINTTNKTISGTFKYKGFWSDFNVTNIPAIDFTEGIFTNLPYDTTETGVVEDTFFAKVDGVEFVENNITVAIVNNQFSIVASKTSNNFNIGLNFAENIAVGTYQISGVLGQIPAAKYNNGTSLPAASGTIKIISKTADRIKGTFSFVTAPGTGTITYQVSEGAFDVEY